MPRCPVDPTWDKTRLKGYDILKGAGCVPLVLFSLVLSLIELRSRQDNTHKKNSRLDPHNSHVTSSHPTAYSELGYPCADTQSPDREYTQAGINPRASGRRRRKARRRDIQKENLGVPSQRCSKAAISVKNRALDPTSQPSHSRTVHHIRELNTHVLIYVYLPLCKIYT